MGLRDQFSTLLRIWCGDTDMESEYTEQDYFKSVQSIASNVWDESEGDMDAAYRLASEDVDSSRWVFIVPMALLTMRYASEPNAFFEDYGCGLLESVDNWGDVVCRCAYFAMLRDVTDAIQALADAKEATA